MLSNISLFPLKRPQVRTCSLAALLAVLIFFPQPTVPFAAQEPDSPSPADRVAEINREVMALYRQGNYGEAANRALEACELSRSTLGEEHPDYATSLDNLALAYKAMGKTAEAEGPLKQALEIRRKALGEMDPDFALSLNSLGGLYIRMGRYAEAEAAYLRSLEIIRAAVGEENGGYVSGLSNLASLYKAMGNYAAVAPLYEKARKILLKLPDGDQSGYAVITSNLGHLYSLTGRVAEAESLYEESLAINRKMLGEDHPQYARTLNNLASLYEASGNYAKAEPLYRQALAVFTARMGEASPDAGAALNNLAGLYKTIGDYGKAEALYGQATEIWRKALGEAHPDVALAMQNMADLRYQMGNFKEAEELYRKVLQIQRSSLGEKHPDVALTMQNLGAVLKTVQRYQEAESLYRQALDIWKGALGENHPDVALVLHNLGTLQSAMGRIQEAESLCRQAFRIRSSVLGDSHPDVAATLNNLAMLCAASSRENEALDLLKRAQEINDQLIRNVFSMTSESQRLGFVKTLRGDMDSFLSLVIQSLPNSPRAVTAGLDLVLKRKAIVAEAMANERDAVLGGQYPDLEPKLLQLRTLRIQIAQKILSGPGQEGPDIHRQLLSAWEAEKEKLETELASRIPEMALERRLANADRQAVAKALPPGSALVEFIRFDPFDFKAVPANNEAHWKPSRYAAFVMAAGEPDNIMMLDLGPAEDIDRMISDYRTTITGESDRQSGRGITATGGDTRVSGDNGARLRGALFDPLTKVLGGRKRVFLAPDGNLYRVPFAALPLDADRYLIDEYHIGYVGSGRDVLRFGSGSKSRSSAPLVIADPDYDLESGVQTVQTVKPQNTASLGRQSRDLLKTAPHFNRLPGTRAEGERIAALLRVTPLLDRDASKQQLRAHASPRILHIATHGFFLPDQHGPLGPGNPKADHDRASASLGNAPLSRSMENPLLRSGLVLAGANTWVQGKRPPPEAGDGILTGEDALGLDILDTELVVLSACETGLGDIRSGEGVFGLRRAFLLAGAKTLVMSLWKVPDSETRMLMEDFYTRLLQGRPRLDALREAQLAIKSNFPGPFHWGAFVCQGDPGPLASHGSGK